MVDFHDYIASVLPKGIVVEWFTCLPDRARIRKQQSADTLSLGFESSTTTTRHLREGRSHERAQLVLLERRMQRCQNSIDLIQHARKSRKIKNIIDGANECHWPQPIVKDMRCIPPPVFGQGILPLSETGQFTRRVLRHAGRTPEKSPDVDIHTHIHPTGNHMKSPRTA